MTGKFFDTEIIASTDKVLETRKFIINALKVQLKNNLHEVLLTP